MRAVSEGGRGLVELEDDSVVADLVRDQHGRPSDMPHAMEASVVRGVAAPALHAADIKMAVRRAESSQLRAGTEGAGDALGRALPDSGHFLTGDDPRAAGAEGEVQEVGVAGEGRPTAGAKE